MTHNTIKNIVTVHINNLEAEGKRYGDVRLFKFLISITGSEDVAKEFLKRENYPDWLINSLPRRIAREKQRYKLLKLHSAKIDKI